MTTQTASVAFLVIAIVFLMSVASAGAAETSGEYFRYNTSFEPALKKIEQRNNGYYLISYYGHHPKGTSGYQRVQVATKSRELRVQSREGYVYGE